MSCAGSPAAPPPAAPHWLRARPVRPRAPCPVVWRARLRARGTPVPFSFREPTLIEATISL